MDPNRTWRHDLRDDTGEFSTDVARTAVHVFAIYLIMDKGLHVEFGDSMVTGFTVAAVRVFDVETKYFSRSVRRIFARLTKDEHARIALSPVPLDCGGHRDHSGAIPLDGAQDESPTRIVV